MFVYRHIPVLIIAFLNTFGGIWPMVTPRRAMMEYGFPERIANQPATYPVMALSGGRSTALGLLLFVFYIQGELAAVDTVLVVMGFGLAIVDVIACWKAGVLNRGLGRAVAGALLGLWGAYGVTEGSP